MTVRRTALIVASAALLPALTACGGNATESSEGPREVVVISSNSYVPYASVNENGESVGYDVEVMRAVDELLEDYTFTYDNKDFAQVLVSLDQGRADIAASQLVPNEERLKSYLFSETPYTDQSLYIAFPKDGDTFNTLEDLEGRKVAVSAGTIRADLVNEHNATAETKIDVQPLQNTWEEMQIGLLSHTYEAAIGTQYDVQVLGRGELATSAEPVQVVQTHVAFAKDEEELKKAVDGALIELRDSGRLAEIAEKELGQDLTPKS